jgi:putative zinc ribbon protein
MREPRKRRREAGTDQRWIDHRLYGRVPLVLRTYEYRGKRYEAWHCDPAFKPKRPRGAVEGDVTMQVFCEHHVPKYFYVDEQRHCVQCGEEFTFSGREQKYWYEARKFHFQSVPVRCPACRRQRRSEHALREQVAIARRAVETDPRDGAAQLALAQALVELHERTGTGRLDQAIAAARKAARLWPRAPGAADLEARARARRRDPDLVER